MPPRVDDGIIRFHSRGTIVWRDTRNTILVFGQVHLPLALCPWPYIMGATGGQIAVWFERRDRHPIVHHWCDVIDGHSRLVHTSFPSRPPLLVPGSQHMQVVAQWIWGCIVVMTHIWNAYSLMGHLRHIAPSGFTFLVHDVITESARCLEPFQRVPLLYLRFVL